MPQDVPRKWKNFQNLIRKNYNKLIKQISRKTEN